MKKIYDTPELSVTRIENTDVITLSGLIFGGEKGESEKASFADMFGSK